MMVMRKKRVQKQFQGILFNIHEGVTLFVNFITCAFFIAISDWGFCLKPSKQSFVRQKELLIDLIITNCLKQSVRCLEITVIVYCNEFCYMPLNSILHFTKEKADINYFFQKFVSGLVESHNYNPKRLFQRVKQTLLYGTAVFDGLPLQQNNSLATSNWKQSHCSCGFLVPA